MKRESKMDDRQKITITDKGIVDIPNQVQMSIAEIANLFDIYYQPTKRIIRAIEKSGITQGNYTTSCTLEGKKIYPDYYGLKIIVAVAFQIESMNARIFREWILQKIATPCLNIQVLTQEKWKNISLN